MSIDNRDSAPAAPSGPTPGAEPPTVTYAAPADPPAPAEPVTLDEAGPPGSAPPIPVDISLSRSPPPEAAGPPPEPDQPFGRKLGEFCLLREIGRGGMGTVFEAVQEGLGRRVAVKVLRGAAMMDDRAVRRFHREAEAIAHLHHPNIIPVYSVGEQDGTHYYAMELVQGISLARILRRLRSGTLGTADPFQLATYTSRHDHPTPADAEEADPDPEARDHPHPPSRKETTDSRQALVHNRRFINKAVEMIAQVADALHHAHTHGIIHRDIKPGNLLLAGDDRLVVTDFGLAHREGARTLTRTGDFMGTPLYMSPEQAMAGRVPLDHRTDIYSLGVTLYELLTLQAPFEATDTHHLLREVLVKEPRSFRSLKLRLPRDLEVITFKAMEKDPDRRYQSAKEFADDLRRFLNFEAIQARPPGTLTRWARRLRRHRTPLLLAGAAALAAAVLAFGIIGNWQRQQANKVRQFVTQGFQALEEALATADDCEAERGLEGAIAQFAAALALDDRNESATRGQLQSYLARCQRALDRGDYEMAKGILLPLKELDKEGRFGETINQYRRQVLGIATWQIDTTPPGCRVSLGRYDEDFRLGKLEEVGTTPLEPREIAPGSYLLVLSLPGYADVHYPVLVERSETKAINVPLVRKDQVPPGMVYVPAGEFWFGDRQTGTSRKVSLPGFFIDQTEVTGAEYEKFVQATDTPPPERWGGQKCPPALRTSAVHNVSWYDAMEYARWAGKRLPTEQEWEKAARGVDGRVFPWGNRFEPWRCNCRESTAKGGPLQVGVHHGGDSPYGCLDMAGNAWEWTLDREKPNRAARIMRGGAAYSTTEELTTFRRQGAPPGGSSFGALNLTGFRCARSLESEPPRKPVWEELTSPADINRAAEYLFSGRSRPEPQVEKVGQLIRPLLEKNPRSVVGNYWKGRCLDAQGKTREAFQAMKVVYLQRPNFEDTPRQLSQLVHQMRDAGIRVDPLLAKIWPMLREVEQDLDANKHTEAEKLLQQILAFDPDNALAHEKMAEVFLARKRPGEAWPHQLRRIQAYRTELKEDPDNAGLHNEFADFLIPLVTKETYQQEGLASAKKAVALEPENPAYHATLAELYFQTKQPAAALDAINAAIKLNPEEPRYAEQQKQYQQAVRRAQGGSAKTG